MNAPHDVDIFEDALRRISPRGFSCVVRVGVRDLSGFLALDPDTLPSAPRAVREELRQLQAAVAVRVDAERAASRSASPVAAPTGEPPVVAPHSGKPPSGSTRDLASRGRMATLWTWGVPEWSILRTTLPDLLQIDGLARDSMQTAAGASRLSDLNLGDADWRRLRWAGILPDDDASCLLSMTLEYLLRLRIGADAFNSLVNMVISLRGACCQETVPEGMLAASREPVLRADELAGLSKLRLDSFDVPTDITRRMRGAGLVTWADLVGVSEHDVLGESIADLDAFLRVNDLWWLRDYAATALKVAAPLQVGAEDGFAAMAEGLVALASRRPNDEIVFLGRMGLLEGRFWTLQELGERLNLTRERVRQIEQKMRTRLEAPRHRRRFDAIRIVVSQVLRTAGGVCTYEEVGRGLCDVLQWEKTPPVQALGRFLLSFDICECDRDRELASDPCNRCLNCRVPHGTLESMLGGRDIEMAIEDLAAGLSQGCKSATVCHSDEGIPEFSHGYIRRVIANSGRFFADDSTVYSPDAWRLRNGSRAQMVERILRSAGRPMHFREVYDELRASMPEGEDVTPTSVHASLSGADSVLLWDRGTFVYAGVVSIPERLVAEIEAWLIDMLRGGVPFISVAGAFAQFREECAAAGVVSETALYTCLRKSANDELLYPRYPQVYLADSFASRVPALLAIEQYLRDAGREVSAVELADYALTDLCLKDSQFQQCIGQLSGILRTGTGGFVDLALVPVDEVRLERLKGDVLRMVEREGHIAVTRVFEEKRVSCRMMGLTSPEMLYSLLRECDFDELAVEAYPQISLAGRKRKAAEGRGVIAEVVSYIRTRGAPVSFGELGERYVDDLGYNERTIRAAALANGVLRYGQGTVVHVEALAWSGEKQTHLERLALAELERSRERGWVHGMASGLLEGEGLPDLPGRVAWTQTLVCELLALEKRFRVIGNGRNAFVAIPNGDGIQSLDDLVARILSQEFDGASELETFEARARELGIIRRRLTAAMLGDAPRVVVTEHLVELRELRDHA